MPSSYFANRSLNRKVVQVILFWKELSNDTNKPRLTCERSRLKIHIFISVSSLSTSHMVDLSTQAESQLPWTTSKSKFEEIFFPVPYFT